MPVPSGSPGSVGMQQAGLRGNPDIPGVQTLGRAGALAVVAAACILLSGGSAGAKPSFTTFDVGAATAINSSNTVTGWPARGTSDSFVRTADRKSTRLNSSHS